MDVYQGISDVCSVDRVSFGRLPTRTGSFHKGLHLHFVRCCLLSLLLQETCLGKCQAKAQLKQSNLCKIKVVQINKGAGSTVSFFILAIFHIQFLPTPNSRKIAFHSIFWYILQTTVNLLYPFAKSLAFLAIAGKIQADNETSPLLRHTRCSPGTDPSASHTHCGTGSPGTRSRQNQTSAHSSAPNPTLRPYCWTQRHLVPLVQVSYSNDSLHRENNVT